MRSALVTHDQGYQRALKFPYMVLISARWYSRSWVQSLIGLRCLLLNVSFVAPREPVIHEELLVQRDRPWTQIWRMSIPLTEPQLFKLLLGTAYMSGSSPEIWSPE